MPARKPAASRSKSARKPTTRARRYVREEMEHYKEGAHDKRHPIKSPKQAVAIGLSKARRAGVPIPKSPRRRTRKAA